MWRCDWVNDYDAFSKKQVEINNKAKTIFNAQHKTYKPFHSEAMMLAAENPAQLLLSGWNTSLTSSGKLASSTIIVRFVPKAMKKHLESRCTKQATPQAVICSTISLCFALQFWGSLQKKGGVIFDWLVLMIPITHEKFKNLRSVCFVTWIWEGDIKCSFH